MPILQKLHDEHANRSSDLSYADTTIQTIQLVDKLRADDAFLDAGKDHAVISIDADTVFAYKLRENLTEDEWRKMCARHALVELMFPEYFPKLLGAIFDDAQPNHITGTFRERIYRQDTPTDPNKKILSFWNEVALLCERNKIPLHFDLTGPGNLIPRKGLDGNIYLTYVDTLQDLGTKWNIDQIKRVFRERKMRFPKDRQELVKQCINILNN
jgi:hypothetical protein